MADESSFFDTPDDNLAGASADSGYRHFRLIYESEHGFCRLFTARRHGRTYVIKTLREPYLDAPLAHDALRKEFECGMMVDSPYVARTYDFITLPDFGEAIVMEYCPGMTLARIIADGAPLSTADIDKIIFSLARGVDDIHSAGLIHRDLKPDNLIWMPQSGALKIIDFGFCDSESFYMLHDAGGTLRYTPPGKSIAAADAHLIPDTYNDLYAMGVLLTDLLTVAPAHRQKTLKRLSEMLITRSIGSGAELEACYRTLSRRTVSKRRLLIIPAAAVLLLTGIVISILRSNYADKDIIGNPHNDTIVEKPVAHMAGEKELEITAAATHLVRDDRQDPPAEEKSVGSQVPATDDQESPTDMSQRLSGSPEELIKDEYGVCMAETKYTANFRRDKIDEYAVTTTDRLITESIITLQSDTASTRSRKAAYRQLTTDTIVQRRVAALTLGKYPSADRRRILGLSRQRYRYLLSDIDLTHLRP